MWHLFSLKVIFSEMHIKPANTYIIYRSSYWATREASSPLWPQNCFQPSCKRFMSLAQLGILKRSGGLQVSVKSVLTSGWSGPLWTWHQQPNPKCSLIHTHTHTHIARARSHSLQTLKPQNKELSAHNKFLWQHLRKWERNDKKGK